MITDYEFIDFMAIMPRSIEKLLLKAIGTMHLANTENQDYVFVSYFLTGRC